ncbi:MAG TPA: trypsin-like peptidase domain-containing protein [Pyrinomonadaceae bacterium]|nr:trypsin-like peptidase domain-containing protein [Pyrinomonadaceae bacterium]
MNRKIRVIKHGNQMPGQKAVDRLELPDPQQTREIASTIKLWVSEFNERRRTEEQHSRSVHRQAMSAASLVLLLFFGSWSVGRGQQLRDAFHKVKQAVVIIKTQQKELAPSPDGGMVSANGLGSGVLISSDGKILTAAHLVEAADATLVEFADGELIPARVLGAVHNADVALLQLEHTPASMIAVAPLGDSDKVEVGDEVFVVGAPYGLSFTLTAGHISARHSVDNRINDTPLKEFLQTDAAINQGNSGGPMFNMNGEVIGIVTNILSKSGGSEGLGFAATSKMARQLLLDQKPFWSGIEGFLLKGDLAKALNVPQPAGLLVERVADGSPASRAGILGGSMRVSIASEDLLLGGDIILEVNGLRYEDGNENYSRLYARLTKLKAGDIIVIKVLRQGQVVTLSVPITD